MVVYLGERARKYIGAVTVRSSGLQDMMAGLKGGGLGNGPRWWSVDVMVSRCKEG